MTWRRVPLSSRLVVHPDRGRRTSRVRVLAGSSDWRRDLVDRLGTAVVLARGPDSLALSDDPVWPPVPWEVIDAAVTGVLPGCRLLGAATPRQRGRPRLSLLARYRGNDVVVKLGADAAGLDRERIALDLLAHDPLPAISTPHAIGWGALDLDASPVHFLVTTSIAIGRQRAAVDEPLRTFERDLATRLAGLPRDDGDTSRTGLVPVHGDLTPWNLRRTPRGLALFDWESAGWGMPGSDLVTYRAGCDEIRRPWRKAPTTDRGDHSPSHDEPAML